MCRDFYKKLLDRWSEETAEGLKLCEEAFTAFTMAVAAFYKQQTEEVGHTGRRTET